jgi:hypothetical protein
MIRPGNKSDLGTIAAIGGVILFWPLIKSLVNLTTATAQATANVLTPTDQLLAQAAPGIYSELMKRPPLPLPTGGMPTLRRFLTDQECAALANMIEENLGGTSSDWETIRETFRGLTLSVSDQRMIYAQFGFRREWWAVAGGGKKNLFQWFRDNLTPQELTVARQIWRSANIVPAL